MSVDVLEQFQHGHDAVVESVSIWLESKRDVMMGRVVLQVVRVDASAPIWSRVSIEFSVLERVQIGQEWLVGGGCVLYDGGVLEWSAQEGRVLLNMDPGVAWSAAGTRKPVGESTALLSGLGTISVAAYSNLAGHR